MSYRVGLGHVEDQVRTREASRMLKGMLRRIDPYEVLQRYGARNITEMSSSSGTQIHHSCLIDQVDRHHSNGDQNPSASLNAEKLLYNCYSYGGGSLLWLIQKMEGVGRDGAIGVLSELVGGSVHSSTANFMEELEKLLSTSEDIVDIPHYSERILTPWLLIHPYMTEVRGISVEVLKDFKVGYDERDVRIVIPLFWEGRLVGWQKRTQDDPRWPVTPREESGARPKYKNSTGFPKREVLYKSISGKGKKAIVVESPLSVLKWETYLREGLLTPYEEYDVVATFGAEVPPSQMRSLRGYDQLIFWFDEDLAGLRAMEKGDKELSRFSQVLFADSTTQEDDLAAQEPSEILSRLRGATPSFLAMPQIKKKIQELRDREKKDVI